MVHSAPGTGYRYQVGGQHNSVITGLNISWLISVFSPTFQEACSAINKIADDHNKEMSNLREATLANT